MEENISDASGSLTLPRIFGVCHLKMLRPGFSILDARFEGEPVSPAPPAIDPTTSPTNDFGGNAKFGPDPQTSGNSHVRWNASRLYVGDFDDEKARLVVTLAG